jgi:hypothetical protein
VECHRDAPQLPRHFKQLQKGYPFSKDIYFVMNGLKKILYRFVVTALL